MLGLQTRIKQIHLDQKSKEIKKTSDLLNIQLKDIENTMKVTEAYINAKLLLHDDEIDKIEDSNAKL